MFLTELLLAHGARVNQRDLSGNTPLLYACHFYRQHGKGVQLCAQLLFHKADPHYRVKAGVFSFFLLEGVRISKAPPPPPPNVSHFYDTSLIARMARWPAKARWT